MKFLTILAAAMMSMNLYGAEVLRVKVYDKGESIFTDSTKYEVEYCADKKCTKTFTPKLKERSSKNVTDMVMKELAKQLRRKLYVSGYEVDRWGMEAASKLDIVDLLSTDHSDGSGSEAWHEEEIEKLMDYINRDGDHTKTSIMGIMSNYMGGTGIESNVLVYSAKTGWVTAINKFEYAE